jgi:hypothetical protein
MNALELLVLGRRLMKIAGEAMPRTGADPLPTSVRSILIDVSDHPDSSISEITARTGFPQSHVSLAVARLKEGNLFVTTVDPHDRRRTLVRAAPATAIGNTDPFLFSAPIDTALAASLGTDNPRDVAAVVTTLESLAQRLSPELVAPRRAVEAQQPLQETP